MEFHSVGTEEEALERLSELGDDARILAGGTDLVLQHRRGEVRANAWLFIGGLDRLRRIEDRGDAIEVGALATHRMLARHPTVARRHGSIATAAATVGGWQTQAVGTVGGNVCNASPAADLLPPLLVAQSAIRLASAPFNPPPTPSATIMSSATRSLPAVRLPVSERLVRCTTRRSVRSTTSLDFVFVPLGASILKRKRVGVSSISC